MKNTIHALSLAVLGWLSLSPAAAKPPVFPDLSGYVTASGRGLAAQPVAVPAQLAARWAVPFGITRDALGRYATDFAGWPTVPATPDQTFCINITVAGSTSSDSNTGSCGTPDATHPQGGPGAAGYAPFKTLLKGVQSAAAGKTTVVYIDGTADSFFRANNGTNSTASQSWSNSVPAGSLYVVNRSGYRAVSLSTPNGNTQAWTQNSTYPQVYQLTATFTGVGGIADVGATIHAVNPSGGPVPAIRDPFYIYKGVGSLAAVAAQPGTWWADASASPATIYVNPVVAGPNPTGDGSIVSLARPGRTGVGTGGSTGVGTDVVWYVNGNNGRIAVAAAGLVTYIDGLDFVGGSTTFKAQTQDANTPVTLVMKNSTVSGSGQVGSTTNDIGGNAISMLGPVTAYFYRTAVYGGWADNFNAHSFTSDTTNSPSPFFVTVECASWGAGMTGDFVLYPDTTGAQDNAWTNHDGSVGISINDLLFGTRGITLAGGTNYAMQWVLGSTIQGSIVNSGGGNGLGWATATSGANMGWYDGATLVPTFGPVSGVNTNDATKYVPQLGIRNMPMPLLSTDSLVAQVSRY